MNMFNVFNSDKYTILNNGLKMPMLGLGGWGQKKDAIVSAIEVGFRLIDTASQYGNEEDIGKAIVESKINRKKIFLTSKLWTEDVRTGRIREAFKESLDRLQVNYLDLFLIHWPAEGYENAWCEMEKLYKEKRIRAIGISNFQKHHIDTILKVGSVVPSVNQIECHPYFSNDEIIQYCGKNNIKVQAWCPLGGPLREELGNKYILSLAEKYKKSPAQIILRWHIQRGVAVIPKSSQKERLVENSNIFDFALTKDEIDAITLLDTKRRLGADPDNFDF